MAIVLGLAAESILVEIEGSFVGQLVVADSTVRGLIDEQFLQWQDLPLQRVSATGTVHAIFRLGDGLAARFRLEAGEVDLVWSELRAEAEAARELAGCTRFPTPEPVTIGEPGEGIPHAMVGSDLA